MGLDFRTLTAYLNDDYGIDTSGSVFINRGTPNSKPKKNCDNCGSNQIVSNECQHCGTWYGYGQKPKPVKLPTVNPQRIERYEAPKPQSFFQRIFRRKT